MELAPEVQQYISELAAKWIPNGRPVLSLWIGLILSLIVPFSLVLLIIKFSTSDLSAPKSNDTKKVTTSPPKEVKPNFSGIWKRSKLLDNNLSEFVKLTGGSLLQCKLAVSMPSVHTLTMDELGTKLRLQDKSGPIDTDVDYLIQNANPKPQFIVKVLENEFEDTLYWGNPKTNEKDILILKRVHMPTRDYEIIIKRSLEIAEGADNPNAMPQLRLKSFIHNLNRNSDDADLCTEAIYTFQGFVTEAEK